jgi:phenylpropionate dioxygenase-like ring-hydroxylating dioxygenase large terminal subunit
MSAGETLPQLPAQFLPSWLYSDPAVADQEREAYAGRLWHPLAVSDALGEGEVLAVNLLEQPLLLTRAGGVARAFRNRCPHRGVPFALPAATAQPCRRLVCPYHGWTYDLQGRLRAAARESEFLEPFNRDDWPLDGLACQELVGLIWVAVGPDPLPLEEQLDLLLQEAGAALAQPRTLLGVDSRSLNCNWKVAHDNTLDDYHVAIAHPTTLHREQGPVRHYRHALSAHGSLLATPWGEGSAEFLTFGLAPWTHLLFWPDGRLAVIQFPPIDPSHCRMEVWLLGQECHRAEVGAWMADLQTFLEEDRRLVEGAQRGYASGLKPGPPHRLEQRILQQQALYGRLMGLGLLAELG